MLVLAVFFVAFAAVATVLGRLQTAALPAGSGWSGLGRGILALSVPGLLAAIAIYVVLVRRPGWTGARLGWPAPPVAAPAFGVGVLWGGAMAGGALLLGIAGGARIVMQEAPGESYLATAVPIVAGLAVAALLEELLFRGFPLVRLAQAAGRVGASITLAAVFALAHVGNPDTSPVGIVNIGLAALLLSAVFFSPGGLAAAWGLHLGWNSGLVLVGDAPVSGLRFALPVLEYFPGRHGWITGGRFGPEGGLVTTIVMTAALAWWVRRVKSETREAV